MSRPPQRKMKPKVREIADWAGQHGWALADDATGGGHWVLKHPSGSTVALPSTPSDHRGLVNAKATIRRISKLPSDSGPAARYRHEPRRRREDRFNMGAAVAEANARAMARAAAQHQVGLLEEERDRLQAELEAVDPRKEPSLARLLARRITVLNKKIKSIRP